MKKIDFKSLSLPQLREIERVIEVGITTLSETKVENVVKEPVVEPLKETEAKVNLVIETTKAELESKIKEKDIEIGGLNTKLSEVQAELVKITEENKVLKSFKDEAEKATKKAELIKTRKAKIVEAGLDVDIDTESDKWLSMSEEVFEFTVTKMSEIKKLSVSNASKKEVIVPNLKGDETPENKSIIRQGLQELNKTRNKR
jgi:hypothetical protein